MIFDYEMLKLIWWVLIGVLLIGFAVTDGFDMGGLAILPLVAKTDDERRVVINTMAPHWDGNQVWFITAGGALFAAWPLVYAAAFSGLYWAMLLVLFAMFLRPVGFDYRSKMQDQRWRDAWDWALVVGGAVPALVFGVAFGNLLQGVPFQYDELIRPSYHGSFFALLNPYALLCGVVSLSMLCLHGATWVQMRTHEAVEQRSRIYARIFALVCLVSFALAGLWLAIGIDGYKVISMPATDVASNPMLKEVVRAEGAWLSNYANYPVTMIAPVLGFLGLIGAYLFASANKAALAFLFSGLGITGIILTAGVSMFPFVMPSSLVPNHSLTLWDAASGAYTLMVMTWAAAIFVPIILGYTFWCYRALWSKIGVSFIKENNHSLY